MSLSGGKTYLEIVGTVSPQNLKGTLVTVTPSSDKRKTSRLHPLAVGTIEVPYYLCGFTFRGFAWFRFCGQVQKQKEHPSDRSRTGDQRMTTLQLQSGVIPTTPQRDVFAAH
jgi:hypothetical protein